MSFRYMAKRTSKPSKLFDKGVLFFGIRRIYLFLLLPDCRIYFRLIASFVLLKIVVHGMKATFFIFLLF